MANFPAARWVALAAGRLADVAALPGIGAELRIFHKLKIAAALLLALLVSGCSGAGNLASNFGLAGSGEKAQTAAKIDQSKTIAFAPLVGVPAQVSSRLLKAVKSSARSKNMNVTEEIAQAGYLMRGYLVAAPETGGAKLSYIWDINDSKGVRIHRLMGSEFIKGGKTQNAWSLVSDQVIAKVADSSTSKISGWLSKAGAPASPAVGPKNIAPQRKELVAQNSKAGEPEVTGALARTSADLATRVVPVQGAPGDGRISLTNALRRELKKSGISLTNKRLAGGYTVKGIVKLKGAGSGAQEVRIIWNVYDGKGNRVGTVSQKNKIPTGSLNGAWGRTAEAAASAAAKGIIKLLPGKRS